MFAQDQVAPLPPPAKPVPLTAPIAEITGDSHEHLIAGSASSPASSATRSCVCDTGPADGTLQPQDASRSRSPSGWRPTASSSPLIHELAHALVGADEQAPKLAYAQEELVVESIAFCCCQTVGLDTSANSIPYLASWAEQASVEVLEQTVELTARLADRIEAVLIPEPAAAHPTSQELVDAPQPVAV